MNSLQSIDRSLSCAICLEDILPVESTLTHHLANDDGIERIRHIFHSTCLKEWFKNCSSETRGICPLCKIKTVFSFNGQLPIEVELEGPTERPMRVQRSRRDLVIRGLVALLLYQIGIQFYLFELKDVSERKNPHL